ncbi:hypothetical protein SAMN05421505_106239 [Sinosporangium album]|uniref:Uncharacterized protein n=1 Tax=Sinosporangium album TaxID=504805 RepID=A0A1G7W813_9ACTN|nr:hypothetical protein SAMN05421505_106239 [Sinosporangium album]
MSASEGMTLTADTQAAPVSKDSRGRTFIPPTGQQRPTDGLRPTEAHTDSVIGHPGSARGRRCLD